MHTKIYTSESPLVKHRFRQRTKRSVSAPAFEPTPLHVYCDVVSVIIEPISHRSLPPNPDEADINAFEQYFFGTARVEVNLNTREPA